MLFRNWCLGALVISHTINDSRSLWVFFFWRFLSQSRNAPLPITDEARANSALHYDLDTVSWSESKSSNISVTISWKTISSSESVTLTAGQFRKVCTFILPVLTQYLWLSNSLNEKWIDRGFRRRPRYVDRFWRSLLQTEQMRADAFGTTSLRELVRQLYHGVN